MKELKELYKKMMYHLRLAERAKTTATLAKHITKADLIRSHRMRERINEIAEKLEDNHSLLETRRRNTSDRHKSIEMVFEEELEVARSIFPSPLKSAPITCWGLMPT